MEILREQVSLLRHNFPMTLLASLATAFGTLWVMRPVADPQAMLAWLISHILVVSCVYAVLLGIDRQGTAHPKRAVWRLMVCMSAMGISWGSLGYVVLYWRIVRFRSPRLLRILGSRPVPLDAGDNRGT